MTGGPPNAATKSPLIAGYWLGTIAGYWLGTGAPCWTGTPALRVRLVMAGVARSARATTVNEGLTVREVGRRSRR